MNFSKFFLGILLLISTIKMPVEANVFALTRFEAKEVAEVAAFGGIMGAVSGLLIALIKYKERPAGSKEGLKWQMAPIGLIVGGSMGLLPYSIFVSNNIVDSLYNS